MRCNEIENRLPAYLEGLLPPEEMKGIAGHIASCPRCSRAIADLKMAEKLVQDLSEVEPPPFFEQRIMSRVREEAGRGKGILRRLFFPLHIKIPIQALATLVIAVLAFHVYQEGGPEMKRIVPLSVPPIEQGADRMTAEPAKPPASPPPVRPSKASPAPAADLPQMAPRSFVAPPPERRDSGAMTADSQTPMRQEGTSTTGLAAPVPAAVRPAAPLMAAREKDLLPAGGNAMERVREQTGKEESAKTFDTSSSEPKRREKAADAGAASGEGRQMMSTPAPARMKAAAIPPSTIDLTIQVRDPEAALRELESSLARVNARIVERQSRSGGEFWKVEMAAQNLSQWLGLLDRIGRVSPKPDASAASGGLVTLGITVSGPP